MCPGRMVRANRSVVQAHRGECVRRWGKGYNESGSMRTTRESERTYHEHPLRGINLVASKDELHLPTAVVRERYIEIPLQLLFNLGCCLVRHDGDQQLHQHRPSPRFEVAPSKIRIYRPVYHFQPPTTRRAPAYPHAGVEASERVLVGRLPARERESLDAIHSVGSAHDPTAVRPNEYSLTPPANVLHQVFR